MPPKIRLLRTGEPARKVSAQPHAATGHVEGTCPECGAAEFRVHGTGRRPSADDLAWETDAISACCKAPVGLIRHETGTFFGVREDALIATMGIRIY